MKIAICDGCIVDINATRDIISKHSLVKNSYIKSFTVAEKLLDAAEKEKFDIVFLDVDIPEINGLELGKRIKDFSPDTFLIFVTSYPQYAIEAYDCEAFNYLLKPLDKLKAHRVLDRIEKKLNDTKKYYIIKIKSESIRIPIRDIYYVECCKKHIIYHLKDTTFDTIGKLSDVYGDLKDYGFYQVHQGYIVNMDKIRRIDGYSAILENGENVMISGRKKADTLLAYSNFIEART